MDTIFMNTKCWGGAHDSQIFFGLFSRMMNSFPIPSKEKKHVTKAYQDFCRQEGCPTCLHRDQAPEQMCDEITEWNQRMMIKDTHAEVDHPNQNPVEAECIRILKAGLQGIMTRTSAPKASWPYILKYLCDVNNHCARPMLNWKTPMSVRHGYTPDMSAFLQFQFHEPICFQVDETSPSTGEVPGHWIGVAENVGDALTYHIWSHKTQNVLQRSVIRTADPKKGGIINMKHPFDEESMVEG